MRFKLVLCMVKTFSTWNALKTTADSCAVTHTPGTSLSVKKKKQCTHLALWTQILPHLYPWVAGEVIVITQDKRRLRSACLNYPSGAVAVHQIIAGSVMLVWAASVLSSSQAIWPSSFQSGLWPTTECWALTKQLYIALVFQGMRARPGRAQSRDFS